MASSVISCPYNITKSGRFFKSGAYAGYYGTVWSSAGTIPEGYRPVAMAGFIGPCRAAAGSVSTPAEIRFNSDGTIVLMTSGMTEFYGLYMWPII